jgi:hypothetical protein
VGESLANLSLRGVCSSCGATTFILFMLIFYIEGKV